MADVVAPTTSAAAGSPVRRKRVGRPPLRSSERKMRRKASKHKSYLRRKSGLIAIEAAELREKGVGKYSWWSAAYKVPISPPPPPVRQRVLRSSEKKRRKAKRNTAAYVRRQEKKKRQDEERVKFYERLEAAALSAQAPSQPPSQPPALSPALPRCVPGVLEPPPPLSSALPRRGPGEFKRLMDKLADFRWDDNHNPPFGAGRRRQKEARSARRMAVHTRLIELNREERSMRG